MRTGRYSHARHLLGDALIVPRLPAFAAATVLTLGASGCRSDRPGGADAARRTPLAAASDAVLPSGTYRVRAHVRAVDYPDQRATVDGQLRITDTVRRLDGTVAHFREDVAGRSVPNSYDGTILFTGDTARIGLICSACRVNAAFGPVSRTTEWSGRYVARAVSGGRYELRQVHELADPPRWRLTVDTLVREGR